MKDISKKSISCMIDELVTSNLKCWHAQEGVCRPGSNDADVSKSAKLAQAMNARRCALMRAIDERLGDADVTVTPKTYDR